MGEDDTRRPALRTAAAGGAARRLPHRDRELRLALRRLLARYQGAVPPPRIARKWGGTPLGVVGDAAGAGEADSPAVQARRLANAKRHSALMGAEASLRAARRTGELEAAGVAVKEDDAVVHVDWARRKVVFDADARPAWLPPGAPWGPELMEEADRATLVAVYAAAQAALREVIEEDAAALGRGGVEWGAAAAAVPS